MPTVLFATCSAIMVTCVLIGLVFDNVLGGDAAGGVLIFGLLWELGA